MPTYGDATIVIRADASKVEKDIDRQASSGTKRAGRKLADALNSGLLEGTKSLGKDLSSNLSTSLAKGFSKLTVLDTAKTKMSGLIRATDSVRDSLKTAVSSTTGFVKGIGKSVTENEKLKKSLGGTYTKLKGVGTGLAVATAGLGAIGPPLAALTASTAALGAGMFGAQLGVVAFVQAAKPQLENVTDALTLYEATQENVGQTTKAVKQEQKKYQEALKGMPPAVRAFTLDLIKLKDEYEDWSAKLAPDVFKPFKTGINIIRTILPQLSPLVRGTAGVFEEFAQSVLKASKSDEFFTWVADFSAAAGYTLANTLETVKNLFVGVLAILHAFAPASSEVSGGLVTLSASFRDWAMSLEGSQGMEDFLAFGQQSGPMLKNLGSAFLQIMKAMEPFAGSMLITANAFSVLVANTPAPVIAALAQAFVAASVAARLYAPVATAVKTALDIGGVATKTVTGVGQFTAGLFSAKAAASEASGTIGTLGGKVRDTGAALVSATASAFKWAAAQTAMSVATAASTTKLVIQQTAMKLIHGATLAWTAAQWLLNTALIGNPIGIVIAVIVALVAAIVVAYKNSETFRNVVQAVWSTVKSAISSVVSWVTSTAVPALSGAWSAIWSALKTVASAISSAWNSVWSTLKTVGSWVVNTLAPWFKTFQATLEFVFKAIIILIKAWWELSVKPTFTAATAGLKALGAVFTWLYDNAVKPAWNAIKSLVTATCTALKTQWTTVVQPALKSLGAVFKWLYDSAIKPAWNSAKSLVQSVCSSLKTLWTSTVQPALKALGSAFSSLYNSVIKPVWNSIKSAVSGAWSAIKPVFSAMKIGVAAVKTAFGAARDGIRTAWNSLEGIAKKPIKFMINTVLNKGLIKAFNWLGAKVGGPHIDNIPLPFAKGGVLPGYTPGRDVHQFYSPTGGLLALSGGEAVMRPEFTKAVGGPKGVDRLNTLARSGELSGDFAGGGVIGRGSRSGGVHHYLGGGVIDWIKKQGSNAFDWVGDKASAIWQAFKNPIKYFASKVPTMTGTGVVKDLAGAARVELVDSSVDKVKSMFDTFNKAYSAGGGVKFAKMKTWINDHLGIPYLWGGTGPRYDCSGFTQAASKAGGVSIPRTAKEQQKASKRIAGSAIRGGDLAFNGSPAHHVMMALGGGKWAQAPHSGDVTKISTLGTTSFTNFGRTFAGGGVWKPPVFDNGGILPPGVSAVSNRTGRPESLIPTDQLPVGDTNISIQLSLEDLAQLKTLDDFLEMLKGTRGRKRRTARSGTVTA